MMTTYLINHLRIPDGIPNSEGLEDVENWYNSPEYQKILHLRTGNVISDLILVDQVGPQLSSARWARQIRGNMPSASDTAR